MDGDHDIYVETRSRAFGDEVQRRILVGTFVLSSEAYSAYFEKAQRVRRLIRDELVNVLRHEGVNALLVPTALGHAPFASAENTPIELYLNDIMTVQASLAGLPAVSFPAGLSSEGLPLGIQVVSSAFDESTALRIAHVCQQASSL